LMYSQDNKGRRIHLIVLAPSFEIVEQINELLARNGRLDYDGRPIFNIPCPNFVEMMKSISEDIEIIPAHCLLPDTIIKCNPKPKKIKDIIKGNHVLTHNGRFKRVIKIYKRDYKGKIYHIIPWYFRQGLATTPEHPFYVIKSFKKCSWIKGTCKPLCSQKNNCKKKIYLNYKPEWIQAKDIEVGDFLVYPRIKNIKDIKKIKISDFISRYKIKEDQILSSGSRAKPVKNEIELNKEFCRLVGYYMSEGYTIRNEAIAFSFHEDETEYIKDVCLLIKKIFGLNPTKTISKSKGKDIVFYSHILNRFFRKLFYDKEEKGAWNKTVPRWMLFLPLEKQAELLRGWWRGDSGYTTSHSLSNLMQQICLRLGILPSISIDYAHNFNKRGNHFIGKRKISTNRDIFIFSNLSFFDKSHILLKDHCFKKFINKRNMKHGWIDENYAYLPVRKKEIKNYEGCVYNLEVEDDNSYVAEFATVHNCWTPWFGLLGSQTGFDTVEDCFKDQTKHIYALETGLSSDPEMNWRLSALDKYTLVSNSDLHSFWPWRLGRECNIFEIENLTYNNLIKTIRTRKGFKETIEVDPSYGKYHYDGHRNCNISFSPKESLEHRDICPVCGRKLTIGVLHRVEELADREEGFIPKNAVPFKRIIPLSELLAKLLNTGIATQKTWKEYNNLVMNLKNEYNVLLHAKKDELLRFTDEKIADIILQNRKGQVNIEPGYDGEYGYPILSEKDIKKKEDIEKSKEQKGLQEFFE